MKERRRLKRKKISYYLKVVDTDTLKLVGHLTDITIEGFNLDSQHFIAEGTELNLSIETTPDVCDTDFISFKAQSVWCKMDKIIPNVFNVGFQIMDIGAREIEVLHRISEKYGS